MQFPRHHAHGLVWTSHPQLPHANRRQPRAVCARLPERDAELAAPRPPEALSAARAQPWPPRGQHGCVGRPLIRHRLAERGPSSGFAGSACIAGRGEA